MKENNPYDSNVVKENLGDLLTNNTISANLDGGLKVKNLTAIKQDFCILVERLQKSISEQNELLGKLDGEIKINPPSNPNSKTNSILESLDNSYNQILVLIKEQEKIATRLSKIIG